MLEPVLATLPPAPIFCAPQSVLDQIVGFPIHRGVLAVGRRGEPVRPDDLLGSLEPRSLIVVLFGIGNHDNMGAIFRNAAAFGAGGVLLDSTCCDPLYRKAIRVSVGAALTMPCARIDASIDPVALLAAHGFSAHAFSPAGSQPLSSVRRADRMALLFGAEGPGLPPGILSQTKAVAIPMAGAFDSLNVATSCGIALHHLTFSAKPEARKQPAERASTPP